MIPSRFGLTPKHADLLLQDARRVQGRSLWRDAGLRLRASRLAKWSLRFLIGFCILSLLTPLLPLPSPIQLDLQPTPRPPRFEVLEPKRLITRTFRSSIDDAYWDLNPVDRVLVEARVALFGPIQTAPWLGTDAKGRDILSRILWGSRTTILVALAAAACSLVIGVTYGAFAGLVGGRVDNLMMRIVDVLYSIPFIFIVIFVLTLLSAARGDPNDEGVDHEAVFFVVIGAFYWLTMARVVRGQVLALKSSEFIAAARALGASTPRILVTHVLPNVMSIVVVYLTLTIPAVMLFESFLSFLGLGIQPPKVSWGLLAVDGTDSINPLENSWWLVVFPGLAMGSVLLALSFVGDGLRDALDPRERGRA